MQVKIKIRQTKIPVFYRFSPEGKTFPEKNVSVRQRQDPFIRIPPIPVSADCMSYDSAARMIVEISP